MSIWCMIEKETLGFQTSTCQFQHIERIPKSVANQIYEWKPFKGAFDFLKCAVMAHCLTDNALTFGNGTRC